MIFLQNLTVGGSSSAGELVEKAAGLETVSLLDLILKGGWTMIPLFALSIIAVYIFVERLIIIRAAKKNSKNIIDTVKKFIVSEDLGKAHAFCQEMDTPISRMLDKGISRIGSPLKIIEGSLENVGKVEVNNLENNLSTLATISGAAPMIGFLGTVIGMIEAFMSIAQQEAAVSPKDLSGGIYEAMITTATGLIVGIIAYVAYNYLSAQIQILIRRMEYASIEFMDLLQEPK